jgi:hypothetical protein
MGASRVNQQVPHSRVGILSWSECTYSMYRCAHGPAVCCSAHRPAVSRNRRGYILSARPRASGADATVSMWTKTPPANAHVYEDVYEDTVI